MTNMNFPTIETDLVVVGGGPAGFCAAIAAARQGVRVTMVEKNGFAGGMATAGLVGPFMTCYDKSGETMIIRGLFEEVVERLVERGGAIHPAQVRSGSAYTSWISVGHDHCTPFDAEMLKKLIDDMLTEAGVNVLYHVEFLETRMEDNTAKGITVHTKNGYLTIHAKVVIDCTGDGDAAASAGVPFEMGNSKLGIMQPATMFFRIFAQILMPLTKPAMISTLILSFITLWNDYLSALVFLSNKKLYTVSQAVRYWLFDNNNQNYNLTMTTATIFIIPVIILFVFCQKYFVEGIATSGVKG